MALYSDQDKITIQNTNNRNIIKQITSANGSNIIDLYTPTMQSSYNNWVSTRRDGYITYLDATIVMPSLQETSIPPIPESALPEEVKKLLYEVSQLTQFRTLHFWIRFEGSPAIEKCSIPIFNRKPFSTISLMPFFCGTNNTLDLGTNGGGAGTVISLSVSPPLAAEDKITIFGTAIERAYWEPLLAPPDVSMINIEYASYQRNITDTESVALAANDKRNNATFVNYSDPPVGANWHDYIIWIKQGNGPGKPLSPRGGSYQITKSNYWSGPVKAISTESTLLAVEEGVEV
ncbi:hypothetical protein NIES2119_09980 [[Phormidium ambiguum] IAM M-71]|uniref:Uncharacterized protein n=2 Tax=[Phormidium ambiguum] IAM M-71 TaxID=454136 RepID=A0A1U7IM42_9CYAN|nr:hypothetical protein NIES2119_09980 [Phormidium ambiguum IAM M-71]